MCVLHTLIWIPLLNLVVAEKKGNTFGKCSLSETVNAENKVDQLSQLRNPLNVYLLCGGESETSAGMVAMNTIGWCLFGNWKMVTYCSWR